MHSCGEFWIGTCGPTRLKVSKLKNALPVPLLRQVFLNKGLTREMENLGRIKEALNKEITFLVKPLLGRGVLTQDPLDP